MNNNLSKTVKICLFAFGLPVCLCLMLVVKVEGDPPFDMQPTWSPDGRLVAFTCRTATITEMVERLTGPFVELFTGSRPLAVAYSYFDEELDTCIVQADGGGRIRLTDNHVADYSPSWSPDGQYIAFMSDRDGRTEVFVMGSDGSHPMRISRTEGVSDSPPVWSPDGQKLCFAALDSQESDDLGAFVEHLYIASRDGRTQYRLTSLSGHEEKPRWSPNGEFIAFVRRPEGFGIDRQVEIRVMAPDGSGEKTLLAGMWNIAGLAWSPDGKKLAFVGGEVGSHWAIHLLDVGTGSMVPVTDKDKIRSLDGHVAWSPDGERIAFISHDVYIVEVDSGDLVRLTDSSRQRDGSPGGASCGQRLSWSPDGQHVMFARSHSFNRQLIWIVGEDGSNAKRLTPSW
jgi:Tol biopolymer transport system component